MNPAWDRIVTFVRGRKRHYQVAFGTPEGEAVLKDLAEFCRANDNTIVINPDGSVNNELTYALIGRREVWLRIQQHLNIPGEQLAAIYAGLHKPKDTDQ